MNKVNIVMKNGKEYLVKIPVEGSMLVNELITKYIFANYDPRNAISINTFDLIEPKNGMNSVAINQHDISSIEYWGSV